MGKSERPDSTDFDDIVADKIERELGLIREAIAMVATGTSRRIVVASLRFGTELLPQAQTIAAASGARATAVWTLDRHVHSIAIETDGDGNG